MQVKTNGCSYSFSCGTLPELEGRESYFHLAKTVFGLDFEPWYSSGFCDDKFIPYVLFDNSTAVSSVAVCINDISWQGEAKRYIQISTVMTLPQYRGKGLSRWLMEHVLGQWKRKCNAIYLLANDSVADFYPKFGFEKFTEYDFTIPLKHAQGQYIKLDIANPEHLRLITDKYVLSNPFSALTVDNFSQFMFHCITFLPDNIYYLPRYDAVSIIRHTGNKIICYDVLGGCGFQLSEILSALAKDDTRLAYLGFTPNHLTNCTIIESQEPDNHLFVLSGKENIFKESKIMFPLLSRA